MKYKFVTWNLWNSFKALKLPLEVDFAEPWPRINQRKQMQEKLLADENIDVFFLQEVNPLSKRQRLWRKEFLGVNSQVDQGGVKVLGVGLPLYFENALVTLARHKLHHIKGLRLSSAFGINNVLFSLQLGELRYALFSELDLYDQRILLVNTHLHHGVEWTEKFKIDLDKLKNSGEITNQNYDDLIYDISVSTKRRREELMTLMNEVEKWQKHYKKIIIGGDFNISEDSDYLEIIKSRGFKNYHLNPDYSWSQEENYENLIYSNQMLPPLEQLNSAKVFGLVREHNLRSRNIDHFFVSEGIEVTSIEPFGNEKIFGHNFLPSDHIGVKMEIDI